MHVTVNISLSYTKPSEIAIDIREKNTFVRTTNTFLKFQNKMHAGHELFSTNHAKDRATSIISVKVFCLSSAVARSPVIDESEIVTMQRALTPAAAALL